MTRLDGLVHANTYVHGVCFGFALATHDGRPILWAAGFSTILLLGWLWWGKWRGVQ
jgi:hypothetical protein